MKVLFVGSEAVPFAKTGGLGDVLGALPKALLELDVDARVILPKHGVIKNKFHDQLTPLTNFYIPVGDKKEYVGIETLDYDGVTFYFVDNEYYFGYRDTLYGHYDDGERYGYFNNAVLAMFQKLDYYPDIINVSDWPTGLIPYILNKNYKHLPKYSGIKTVFTIHNIAYQGRFSKDLLKYINVEYGNELEFDNMINFLKCGINSADYVTTVSETYADEILYDYFGFGMNKVLETRKDTLFGIINGIDYDTFNPEVDPKIEFQYKPYNYLKGKRENKAALRNIFDIPYSSKPVIGMVSRLADGKGFDLVKEKIEYFLGNNQIQFIVLGSGDNSIEEWLNYLRSKYPDNVGVYIGYSDKLARYIYAGADYFLMPSRFEPCGLAQMISLKYGTLPIVRFTGGLKDTIIPYNEYTGEGNGFGFDNYDSHDMGETIKYAIQVFKNKKEFNKLVKSAMLIDFSWRQSALKYKDLFMKLKED